MQKEIIITGGAGFIGSHLLGYLNKLGYEKILVVDDLGTSDKWKNLRKKSFTDLVSINSFLDRLKRNEFSKPEIIFHLGACSSTMEKNADYMMSNNFEYSKELALWSLQNNSRFIYASSAATYGNGELGFCDEENLIPQLLPQNIYGYSKLLFDLWAIKTGAIKKFVGIKFFNVYGPNEYHKAEMCSVVFKAYHQILQTAKMQLFKSYKKEFLDGEQKRDFIYVEDCSKVLAWMIEKPELNGIYNLGSSTARSWKDLANAAFKALEIEPKIEFIEMPESIKNSYQYFTQASMEKLLSVGYPYSMTSLEDGVEDYIKNYLVNFQNNSGQEYY